MPKVLKLLIGFGAVALLFFGWLFTFGIQTFVRGEASKLAQKHPGLRLTPVPLANTAVSLPGNTENCNGYTIQMPWHGKEQPKNDVGGKSGCSFSDGRNIVAMYVGPSEQDLNNFYVIPSMRPLLEQKYFGNDPPKADYDLMKRVLAFTPDSLPRYGRWGEMELDEKLFDAKKTIIYDTGVDDVIYSLSTPAFQGFQFSKPGAKASVEVRLYSDQNKVTLTFLTTGKGTPLPQPDINVVVQSVRRDPNAPVESDDSE
jgi:hypothetical protein